MDFKLLRNQSGMTTYPFRAPPTLVREPKKEKEYIQLPAPKKSEQTPYPILPQLAKVAPSHWSNMGMEKDCINFACLGL